MSSSVNNGVKTMHNNSIDGKDEDAYVHAMEISLSFILAPVLVASIDLGLFGIISKIGSDSSNPCVSASKIASHLDTKNSSAPIVLDQMLRLLASHSVLTSSYRTLEDGTVEALYGIGPVGKLFLESEGGVSVAPYARILKYHDLNEICSEMKEAVLEGGTVSYIKAKEEKHYEALAKIETFGPDFDRAMSETSTIIMRNILEQYKGFTGLTSLVDVGGGIGTTLAMIISQYPSIVGINFDLPRILDTASYRYAGIKYVSGDMLEEIPKGDAILMKWILHNWSDEKCVAILKNCYLALPESGKIIVIETLLPSVPETSTLAKFASLQDILMRFKLQAKERTELEYKALAKAAGFSKFKVQYCGCGLSVMELYKQ